MKVVLNGEVVRWREREVEYERIINGIRVGVINMKRGTTITPSSTTPSSPSPTTQPYFRVYFKGLMIAKLTSYKYQVGGTVVLPDTWNISVFGMDIGEELGYLYELVDEVIEQINEEKKKAKK